MHETLWEMHRTQDQFIAQIDMLTQRIVELQAAVLSGQIGAVLTQQQQQQQQQNYLQPTITPVNFTMSSGGIETPKHLLVPQQQQCSQQHSIEQQRKFLKPHLHQLQQHHQQQQQKPQQQQQVLLSVVVAPNKESLNKNNEQQNDQLQSLMPFDASLASNQTMSLFDQQEKTNTFFHSNTNSQKNENFEVKPKDATNQRQITENELARSLSKAFAVTSNTNLTYCNQAEPLNEFDQHQLNASLFFSNQDPRTLAQSPDHVSIEDDYESVSAPLIARDTNNINFKPDI